MKFDTVKEWEDNTLAPLRTCFCVGPHNGEPLCPCMMKDVHIVDGRYVRIEDIGPVK